MTDVDLVEEEERAFAHLTRIQPAIERMFRGDHLSDEERDAVLTVFGMGVLAGIHQGLQVAQGKIEMSYDELIPDTPEELL